MPPELRPSLTLAQEETLCKSLEKCKQVASQSLLDEGLKSVGVFFKGYDSPKKKPTQSTLTSLDLDIPWHGIDKQKIGKKK